MAWSPIRSPTSVATLQIDVLLDTPERRRAVAEATLTFATSLA